MGVMIQTMSPPMGRCCDRLALSDRGQMAEVFEQFGAGIMRMRLGIARARRSNRTTLSRAKPRSTAISLRKESSRSPERKQHRHAEADLGGQNPAQRSDAAGAVRAAGLKGRAG